MILTIIIFIFTLLVLIVSHEFGHFIVAKKFGVKVLEFGFGLPPKIWGKKIGETLVSINFLPIGGFVRLLGEDEVDKKILKEKDSFAAKNVWKRIGIVTAGVVMNLLLAVFIFWIVLASSGFKQTIPLLTPYHFIGVNQTEKTEIVVGETSAGSPAQKAGIEAGDRIVKFNDIGLVDSQQLIDLTKAQYGAKFNLTLLNQENKSRQIEVTPRTNPPEGEGPLGIALGDMVIAELNYQTLEQKIASGFTHSYNLAFYSFNILGKLIATSYQTRNLEPVAGTIAGPVGITNLTASILKTQSPLIPYLNFVALLSLNLAILNILPFPALDGGRIFFLLIEAITRKRVKPEIERWIHSAGMAILIALIVLVTFSDISKLLH
ncbi:MAG: M50 family metallopeptidase [Candidatus Daviesbacteria bacterium]